MSENPGVYIAMKSAVKQDTFDERKKNPLSGRIIKVRKKFNIVWQSHYFSTYKILWPQELQNDKLV